MDEVWKPVYRYHGILEASNLGRIKRLSNEYCHKDKIYKGNIDKQGYVKIHMRIKGKSYVELVHILVAEAFYPIEEYSNFVTHIDKNKSNNIPENLKWIKSTRDSSCFDGYTIHRFDKNGNLIDEWRNIRTMCRELNYDRSNIYKYFAGKVKSVKGNTFKRVYKYENNTL